LRSSRAAIIGILVLFTATLAWAGGRGFRTLHLLDEHFVKHGHEFGNNITREQYLHMAQQLRDSRPGKNVLEAKRPDGGGSKFDRRYNWFVAYDPDGTLRTFFIPNEGIRYFERQGHSRGTPER
jgi:pyocin large subunit-like protein